MFTHSGRMNWYEEENDHIVLIRSDGSVVYEDGWEPEEEDEDEYEIYFD